MRTRHMLVALAVAALAIFAVGCGQSEEQVETAMGDNAELACQGKDGDMTCAATCGVSGEGCEMPTKVVKCEHADGTACECTITCEHDGDEVTCSATCSGDQEVTITCDGTTVTCEHADGSTCTFEHPEIGEGGCSMKTADDATAAGGCPSSKTGGCPGSSTGGCPGSASQDSDAS